MISIDMDTRAVERAFGDVVGKQLPFAMMLTVNEVGGKILNKVEAEIEKSFDRPTRWTKKAFYLRRGTKRNPSAVIERKTAIGRKFYLEVQAQGGKRPQTAVERLLSRRLPYAGNIRTVTPARGAKLNKFGNMSPGQVQKILSGVKVQRDAAQNRTAASTKRKRKREAYFVAKYGGRLSPGIYSRTGRKVKKIMHFSEKVPTYQKRLDIQSPSFRVARAVYADIFRANLKRAIRSAK
jgi:hypothetical protein